MTEKLITGDEFKNGIQKGINKLADAVKDTLGPLGNTVIIKNAFGEIIVTKDGVSVAEEIFLKDPIENVGAEMVKSVAIKANNLAGDGTTTATVLAQAIYNIGRKEIGLGASPLEFTKGLRVASEDLLRILKESSQEVKIDSEDMFSVAMVSSNGDEAVAKVISQIYTDLGINAVISVVQGDGMKTTVNIVKGMQFDRGYLSPYCVTDKIKMKADFENPLILIFDGKISEFRTIYGAVEYAGSKNRPLLIVAENVQDSALRGLIVNHAQGNVRSAVIMSPGYGNKRTERLEDMAILFGGEVVSPETDLENFNPMWLGSAEKAEITNKDTAFIGGAGEDNLIQARAEHLKGKIEHNKGNKYEINILEERLGKLTSGVAMVKVGALSREEGKELLDRVEDCKHAVKASLEEGVVDGGGIALLFASTKLSSNTKHLEKESQSFERGYLALLKAVKSPFNQILTNAGINPELIEYKLMNTPDQEGFNVKTQSFCYSMKEAGIIDPMKVIRIALESSVSIVGTLLTSNYAVLNKQDSTVTNFS